MRYSNNLLIGGLLLAAVLILFSEDLFRGKLSFQTTKIKPGLISEKYLFSTPEGDFQGEGFFVDLSSRKRIFVFNDDFNRNPHDIENLRRKLFAIEKGVGQLNYKKEQKTEVFLIAKSALGAEHRLLSFQDYRELARKAKEIGQKTNVSLVSMEDLDFDKEEGIRIDSQDIKSVGPIVMTSGGSVYVFPVEINNDYPLNIGIATVDEDALGKLRTFAEDLKVALNRGFTLYARDVSYEEQIFVIPIDREGEMVKPLSGWVANVHQVRLEKD